MRIRYVVSTMLFWWRENRLSFEQECDFLRSLGFGVELWPIIWGTSDCRYQKRNWTRLAEATKGMLVALHSRNDGPTLTEWNEQIECAKMLDANIVAALPSLCISEQLDIADWNFAADVVKMADEHKVRLCIETGALDTIRKVGEKFESICYCLDTGFSSIDPKHKFKEYVDELIERTAHLHLSDNFGSQDDHEPPGLREGIPRENWDYLLQALNQKNCDVVAAFEMFPCMPDVMIRQACGFLFNTMKWPNRPNGLPDSRQYGYESL
jgi:sugar phosphate isomerase/epimerase